MTEKKKKVTIVRMQDAFAVYIDGKLLNQNVGTEGIGDEGYQEIMKQCGIIIEDINCDEDWFIKQSEKNEYEPFPEDLKKVKKEKS